MSLQSLEAALTRAAQLMLPGRAHYPSLFGEDGVTPSQRLPHWLVDPIQQEVEKAPELARLRGAWIQSVGSGQRLDPWHIAQAQVYRLFSGAKPFQIITDLVDFAQTNECESWVYVGFYGGGVSNAIELARGVAVMPAVSAPPSLARELVFGVDRWGRPILERGFQRLKPSIALMLSERLKIFSEGIDNAILRSVGEKVQRALRALTLASGYAFIRSWQTSWIAHPAIPYEGLGGYGGSGTFDAPPHPKQGAPVDDDVAKEMYAKIGALKPKVARPVILATDRLRRSRTHPPSPDTALDVGLACEIILLHDVGDNAQLSHQFALRGAYLLGADGSERVAKFESLRDLYKAHSQAAHKGTLKQELLAGC
jgi:hypothetical protein